MVGPARLVESREPSGHAPGDLELPGPLGLQHVRGGLDLRDDVGVAGRAYLELAVHGPLRASVLAERCEVDTFDSDVVEILRPHIGALYARSGDVVAFVRGEAINTVREAVAGD